MGLAVSTDLLADLNQNDPEAAKDLLETFVIVNRILRENGLPHHVEPSQVPASIRRDRLAGFPYSFLHYLRRAYAYRIRDENWVATPLPDGEDPTSDPRLEEESFNMDSHLLCHSDCEGFYVPIQFSDVLFDQDDELPGGMLGSTHALKEELEFVAPALGIRLQNGELTDHEFERINHLSNDDQGIYRELVTWICLYEACNESLKHKTAISFI